MNIIQHKTERGRRASNGYLACLDDTCQCHIAAVTVERRFKKPIGKTYMQRQSQEAREPEDIVQCVKRKSNKKQIREIIEHRERELTKTTSAPQNA